MKRHALLPFLLVASLISSLSCSGPSDTGSPEHGTRPAATGHHPVIVLLLDGVRVDHLAAYGADAGLTPQLDAFASSALRFDWAFTQAPDRFATLASLMTSLYPTTHGLVEVDDQLVDEAVTLSELLSATGLETAAFVEGDPSLATRGLEQGFDLFDVGDQPVDRGIEWLQKNAGADFLLLIDAGAVHATAVDPFEAAPTYAAEVTSLDSSAGRVLAALDEAGMKGKATIAVLSLTGFDLGEHGEVGKPNLRAPVTHIPMLLQGPSIPATTSVDKIVELIDLAPTILELLGEETPAEFQGQSLLPLINGAGTPPYVAFGESPENGGQYYAALGGYRMIWYQTDGSSALFDLAADPLEAIDMAASGANRVAVLEDHLGAWKKMVSAASLDPERRTEELDEEALEQLRSLGYIQ